jgi:hypothetical protein
VALFDLVLGLVDDIVDVPPLLVCDRLIMRLLVGQSAVGALVLHVVKFNVSFFPEVTLLPREACEFRILCVLSHCDALRFETVGQVVYLLYLDLLVPLHVFDHLLLLPD